MHFLHGYTPSSRSNAETMRRAAGVEKQKNASTHKEQALWI